MIYKIDSKKGRFGVLFLWKNVDRKVYPWYIYFGARKAYFFLNKLVKTNKRESEMKKEKYNLYIFMKESLKRNQAFLYA